MASANALYVLRLVLRGGRPREFSTAVWTQPRTEQATRRHAALAASSSLASSAPVDNDFLEPASDDYEGASAFLPGRKSQGSAPIPWPTLFPHGERERQHHARACDLVARLVAENRLEPARKVYKELRALHTPIQHRAIYLSAALNSLDPTPAGRADFLFWLDLVPNRPALNNNPKAKQVWEPVVHRLLAEHLDDPRFLADFLILAGRKGLCPTVLPLLALPLSAVTRPEVSESVFQATIDAYLGSVTSAHSQSQRALKMAGIAHTQCARWWNLYLRSLALVGWNDNARALLFSPPEGVVWSLFTRSVVLGHGLEAKERKAAERAQAAEGELDNPLAALLESPPPEAAKLSRDVRRALDPNNLPAVSALAVLQRRLLDLGRTSLLNRFKHRFCNPATQHQGRNNPTVNETWWHHATIKRHADDGDHAAALFTFREHFLWVGLPPIPSAHDTNPSFSQRRMLPNIRVITTVLPSILETIPPHDAVTYHRAYLKQSLPPALQPTEYTHLAFVRQIGHRVGAEAATTAIQTIAVAGRDPGEPAWNALLLKLIGTGQIDACLAVLQGMETRAELSGKIRMPPPSARTYTGLIRLCIQHDKKDQASAVVERFRAWIDTQYKDKAGDDIAQFHAVKGELSALRRGRKRSTPQEVAAQREMQREVQSVEEETRAVG